MLEMTTRKAIVLSTLLILGSAAGTAAAIAGELPKIQSVSAVGEIQEIVLRSEILGEERTLLVRLPEDYDAGNSRYPVLFLLDAEWHFNLAAADVELLSECSYVNVHPVPRLIVVGLVNHDRNRDYTPTHDAELRGMKFPTSGGAERFRRCLVDEALPLIDGTYRTLPYRILAGWSLGGLFVVDTLMADTPAFDSYLAISPSLWWDDGWALKQLSAVDSRTGPAKAKQLIVTLGSAEQGSMVETATNEFLDHLAKHPRANLTVERVPIEGLGHNYSPKMAFFLGLATIFADWNLPTETLEKGLVAIDAYYGTLTERYGFPVPVPEDVYGKLGWKLFEEDRKDESREVFVAWAARHPRSSVALASLGSFYRETGDRDRAVTFLRRAVELEERSARPRDAYLLDLRRDVDALLREE